MSYTDKTILIRCEECPDDYIEEGLDAMIIHIKTHHPDYTDLEADEYAMRWMDDSFDRIEQEETAYQEDRKNEDRDD